MKKDERPARNVPKLAKKTKASVLDVSKEQKISTGII